MKLLLVLFAALAAGLGLYKFLGGDAGYVHVYLAGYSIELSTLAFALVVLLATGLLYLVFRIIGWLLRAPGDVGSWRRRRRGEKSQDTLGGGMLKLLEGDWKKAEKLLIKGAGDSRIPLVHYLTAARAAQEQGKLDARDEYLALAGEAAPDAELAVALTQARLHQQAGQMEQAVAALKRVGGLQSGNAQVTAMLVQAYDALHDWEKLQPALPVARKQQALPGELLEDMEQASHVDALRVASDDEMPAVWNATPRRYKKSPDCIKPYCRYLMRSGEHAAAEKLLRDFLRRDWNEELVGLYGRLNTDKPKKPLRSAERWLLSHERSAALYLCLARLATTAGDREAARKYLLSCIEHGGGAEAYNELGKLSEQADDAQGALEYYRLGLQQLDDSAPVTALPVPAPSDDAEPIVTPKPDDGAGAT